MSPENQSKIFHAFTQADLSTTRKYGGTGLGLSISNKLLALMGSELKLQSKLGIGSKFYFELACRADYLDERGEWAANQRADGQGQSEKILSQSTDLKILIAEDNLVNMSLIKIILQNKFPNATLVEAANGKIAVEKFVPGFFNLALMEIQMSEMDGLDATRNIRKIESGGRGKASSDQNVKSNLRTPIIALTANTMKGDIDKCLSSGMDDFISKSILNDKLDEILHKWVLTSENTSNVHRTR
jgi:CheY-like chemotaxis protein